MITEQDGQGPVLNYPPDDWLRTLHGFALLPLRPPFDTLSLAYCCHSCYLTALYEQEDYDHLGVMQAKIERLLRDMDWLRTEIYRMNTWQEMAQRIVADWEPRRQAGMPRKEGDTPPVARGPW